MSETRFYHLTRAGIDGVLPEMLGRALGRGQRAVVKVESAAEAERLAVFLWTYAANAFLPHGTARDGSAELQPIWITERDENPGGADLLFVLGGAEPFEDPAFSLRCLLFDGREAAAVETARERWKTLRAAGRAVAYWRQNEQGGWEQPMEKAS